MKSQIMPYVGMALSLAFIILLVMAIHPDQVWAALIQAEYWWLGPAVLVSLSSFIFRSYRFRVMLRPIKYFSLKRAYQYIAINYMANNVLPARAGEVMLSYVVRKQEQIPLSSSLAVTVLGRAIDGLLLLTLFLFSLQGLDIPSWANKVLLFGFILFGGAMLFLMWLVFGKADHWSVMRGWMHGLVPNWLDKFFHIGATQLKQFRSGIMPIKSLRVAGIVIMTSLVNWICEGTVYYLVGQAFGLELSIINWLFVIALTNLAGAIPSGPAGIGTFEGVAVLGLAVVGVSTNHATAYALVLHATQVVPITIIGAISYFKMSLTGTKLAEA